MGGKDDPEAEVGVTGMEREIRMEGGYQVIGLTPVEKKFLLVAERGDCATVKSLLEEYKDQPEILDINCVDPLNRSALISAIENENMELIRILLDYNIKVKDALLHAIKEEYVEAVEVLLEWEEQIHVSGQLYSWEAVDRSSSNFTPDITPLILAAHMNNYEILKLLLDRGATLPIPHDIRCACDECVRSREEDSLRHSQSRINAYRALSSSSLIALSSRDPVLTAFRLSWELRRMSRLETEFRADYNFVAHPNVQQLLAAIWYEGLPGFRRKGMAQQLMEVAKLGAMFPVYTVIYMVAPTSKTGLFMKKPFVKFICHSASYGFFLMLLGMASQRVETLLLEWFGTEWMRDMVMEWKRKERGSIPGLVESLIIVYIVSLVWNEARALWSEGLLEYLNDLWNIVDFISNMFYCTWICMRATSWFIVQRESWNGLDPYYPRENWDMFDPMLISEGAFAAGMIFSFLKLVHIFSVNPHLGPLQISLGRMIIDILKFFFIYTLVLFAFGCGLNQLMWYYADLEKTRCYHLPDGRPDFDTQDRACTIWRRFSNLFETSQSLFWAGFGLVDLMNFELTGIKGFTRFWALLMFGSYSVINIIVLLNMLIAMMSNSYQIISERSDVEWKFARSRLWVSYFEDDDTIPIPFNLMPSALAFNSLFRCGFNNRQSASMTKKSRTQIQERYEHVMRLLVRRYVTAEQRKRDVVGITEDDVMEIRQDISTLRFELIDILHNNGMKTPKIDPKDSTVPGKKGRVMERRLLKDFQIGFVEGIVNDVISSSDKEPRNVFTKIAKAIGRKGSSQKSKKDWNALVRQGTLARDPIGSTSEARSKRSRQSARKYIIDHERSSLTAIDPEKLLEYNPKLSLVSPAARVAYAKFKISKIKTEYSKREEEGSETNSENMFDMGDSVEAGGEIGFRTRTPIQEDPREESEEKSPTPEADSPMTNSTGPVILKDVPEKKPSIESPPNQVSTLETHLAEPMVTPPTPSTPKKSIPSIRTPEEDATEKESCEVDEPQEHKDTLSVPPNPIPTTPSKPSSPGVWF